GRVGLHHLVPVGVLHSQRLIVLGDARIVHEDGDGALPFLDLGDERVHLRCVAHVQYFADAGHSCRAFGARRRAEHLGALPAELGGDRVPDAARSARDERELALEHAHAARSACSAASSDARSCRVSDCTCGAMRLVMPASTRPGPHSIMCVAPLSSILRIVSTQRTGDAAWRTSASLMCAGSRSIFTSTLFTTANCGVAMRTFWMCPFSRSAAGCMSVE